MATDDTAPVHLHCIDPSRNMRRFYRLTVQPTLFGGASVIRHCGRIGTGGQLMIQTFDHPEEACQALDHLKRSKRRKGYTETSDPA